MLESSDRVFHELFTRNAIKDTVRFFMFLLLTFLPINFELHYFEFVYDELVFLVPVTVVRVSEQDLSSSFVDFVQFFVDLRLLDFFLDVGCFYATCPPSDTSRRHSALHCW